MGGKITILGPGLLGASLGMAVRERGLFTSVQAWSRSPETREKCRRQLWCSKVHETPEAAVADAQLIVLCPPVQAIPALLSQLAEHLPAETLVTDVGSTKASICEAAAKYLPDHVRFVGSHPMAGSEKTGLEHARSDLFEGQACILTPTESSDPECLTTLEDFWSQLGMQVGKASPTEHDQIVAAVSHLPHLLASVLSENLAGMDPAWKTFAGNGLRDTTRVAAGDPHLWRQILEDNSTAISDALNRFTGTMDAFAHALNQADFDQVESSLAKGKSFRDSLG